MAPSVRIHTEIPGPRSRAILRLAEQHTPVALAHTTPIAVAHVKGALVTCVDGNTLIDFSGGIGVLNAGHRADEVVAAIKDQADRYLHVCFMVLLYEPYVQLCRKLNEITPGTFPKKTILFNSGAEAVDNAVKIARARTGRPAIVCFERSFHGRTLGALTLTGQVRPYKEGFGPFLPEVYRLPYPYCYRCPQAGADPCCALQQDDPLGELFRTHVSPQSVAAVIIEPVLGEGGFVVPPKDYLVRLQKSCQEHGILLIADEIQTGFARTGRMFAVEHAGIAPDLIVMAKSLGGGETLSAVTGRADIMDALRPGSLGGTYGGNPLSCRAALATIEVIESQGLVARAQALGAIVRRRFDQMQARYSLIGEVRGLGAMMALELVSDRATKAPATTHTAAILRTCYENGLIVLRAGASGNVIRTLMPLVITDDQLEEGLDILEKAIAKAGAIAA